jgi:hypothetical protein
LKYNELKSLAKERGLDASGTKEELVARLSGAGVTGASEQSDGGDTEPAETVEKPVSAKKPAVSEQAEEKKAETSLRNDARAMKAHLDAQPKVSIMIPFEVGENPENGKKVMFHCNLNGYAMDIPRGVYVEVPRQVADMIKERLESEGKIGAEWRIDRDAEKQEALG